MGLIKYIRNKFARKKAYNQDFFELVEMDERINKISYELSLMKDCFKKIYIIKTHCEKEFSKQYNEFLEITPWSDIHKLNILEYKDGNFIMSIEYVEWRLVEKFT